MKREYYQRLIDYKLHGKYAPDLSDWDKWKFRSVAARYDLIDGKLMRESRPLIAEEDINETLQKLYNDPATFCNGRDRFYARVATTYSGITKADVASFLKAQYTHQVHSQRYIQRNVRSIVISKPQKYIQCDLIDMRSLSAQNGNYKWILTIIDLFTKIAYTFALKSKKAIGATETPDSTEIVQVMRQLFTDFKAKGGIPSVMQTDNGGEFNNSEIAALCKEFGVRHINSRSHTPQSQGAIERFNKTLKRLIYSNFTQHPEYKHNWVKILPALTANYNSTYHTIIKTTPSNAADNVAQTAENIKEAAANRNIIDSIHHSDNIKVGDSVRVSLIWRDAEVRAKELGIGTKKYLVQWSDETYKVNGVIRHKIAGVDSTLLLSYKLDGVPEIVQRQDVQKIEDVVRPIAPVVVRRTKKAGGVAAVMALSERKPAARKIKTPAKYQS